MQDHLPFALTVANKVGKPRCVDLRVLQGCRGRQRGARQCREPPRPRHILVHTTASRKCSLNSNADGYCCSSCHVQSRNWDGKPLSHRAHQ
jgi:hypothetical protein